MEFVAQLKGYKNCHYHQPETPSGYQGQNRTQH
jgi:hypothetical protein